MNSDNGFLASVRGACSYICAYVLLLLQPVSLYGPKSPDQRTPAGAVPGSGHGPRGKCFETERDVGAGWLMLQLPIFHFHFQHIRLPFWDVSFRFDVSWDVAGSSTTGRGIPPPKCPTAHHPSRPQPTNQPASQHLTPPRAPSPSHPSIHPTNHPLLKQRKRPRESSTGRRAELSEPGVGEAVLCMIPNSKNPPSSP